MAKLKAPLLSLGASGQLGKALVYFPWKGLDVVREYVVPSNPKTSGQTTQRGYLSLAVTTIHAMQTIIVEGFDAVDISAVRLWASIFATPRTWFNQLVKNMCDISVAGNTLAMMRAGTLDMTTPAECYVKAICSSASMVNATYYWGTSKTALINTEAAAVVAGYFEATITGLTAGVKYYFQLRADTGDACEGLRSGIYAGIAT